MVNIAGVDIQNDKRSNFIDLCIDSTKKTHAAGVFWKIIRSWSTPDQEDAIEGAMKLSQQHHR